MLGDDIMANQCKDCKTELKFFVLLALTIISLIGSLITGSFILASSALGCYFLIWRKTNEQM